MSGCKVVVIGCNGLVGARLCRLLQKKDTINISPTEELALTKLTLFDLNEPKMLDAAVTEDPRVEIVLGDLTDKETMEKVVVSSNTPAR